MLKAQLCLTFLVLAFCSFSQKQNQYYRFTPPADTVYDFSRPANSRHLELEKQAMGIWLDSPRTCYVLLKSALFGEDTFELRDYLPETDTDTMRLSGSFLMTRQSQNTFKAFGVFWCTNPELFFLNRKEPYSEEHLHTRFTPLPTPTDSLAGYLLHKYVTPGYHPAYYAADIKGAWETYYLGDSYLNLLVSSRLFGKDTMELWRYIISVENEGGQEQLEWYEKIFLKPADTSNGFAYEKWAYFRKADLKCALNTDSTLSIYFGGKEEKFTKIAFVDHVQAMTLAKANEQKRNLIGAWQNRYVWFKLYWLNGKMILNNDGSEYEVTSSAHPRGIRIDYVVPRVSKLKSMQVYDKYNYHVISNDLTTIYYFQHDFTKPFGYFQAHKRVD